MTEEGAVEYAQRWIWRVYSRNAGLSRGIVCVKYELVLGINACGSQNGNRYVQTRKSGFEVRNEAVRLSAV